MDDTIVRGNIIKSIIKHLKKCKVGEIHIRIPAPPVIDICELGIAITKKEELLMNNKTIEEARKELEVDSLVFLTTEELELRMKQIIDDYSPLLENVEVEELIEKVKTQPEQTNNTSE